MKSTPCADHLAAGKPDLWFPAPPIGGGTTDARAAYKAGIAQALAICDGCPFKAPCLDIAVTEGHPGIWGGTTEEQRKHASTLACGDKRGTIAGRQRHRKIAQKVCDPCREAWNANKLVRRAAGVTHGTA